MKSEWDNRRSQSRKAGTFLPEPDADQRQSLSPPMIRSRKFDSPVQSAAATFSAHTSAVIHSGEVAQLLSKPRNLKNADLEETDVLTVTTEFCNTARYSTGLKVSDAPPFVVENVSHLQDASGEPVTNEVGLGDKLHAIGQFWVGQASIDVIEHLLSGEKNSIVEMVLEDAATEEYYGFFALCHVPLSMDKTPIQKYRLKDHLQSEQVLLADVAIVDVLEELRQEMSTSSVRSNLMHFGQQGQTSLGIRVAFRWSGAFVSSGSVEDVVAGSTADPALKVGDEIISVDGVDIAGQDQEGVFQLFRGSDKIGSSCTMAVRRGGQALRVEVKRTSAACNKDAERLVELCGELDHLIQSYASESALRGALQRVVAQAILVEHRRGLKEGLCSRRLADLQARVVRALLCAQALLAPPTLSAAAAAPGPPTAPRELHATQGSSGVGTSPPSVAPSNASKAGARQGRQTAFVPGKTLMESMQERDIGAVDLLAVVQSIPPGAAVDDVLHALAKLSAGGGRGAEEGPGAAERDVRVQALEAKLAAVDKISRMERAAASKAQARAAELQRKLRDGGGPTALRAAPPPPPPAPPAAALLSDDSGQVSPGRFEGARVKAGMSAGDILEMLEAMAGEGAGAGVSKAEVLAGVRLLQGPPRRSVEALGELVEVEGRAKEADGVMECLHEEIMRMQADFARMTSAEQEMREQCEQTEAALHERIEALQAEARELKAKMCHRPEEHELVPELQRTVKEQVEQRQVEAEELGRAKALVRERDKQNEALAAEVRSVQRALEQRGEGREDPRQEAKAEAAEARRAEAEGEAAAARREREQEQTRRRKLEEAVAELERERGAREEKVAMLEEELERAQRRRADRAQGAEEDAEGVRAQLRELQAEALLREAEKVGLEEEVQRTRQHVAMLQSDKTLLERREQRRAEEQGAWAGERAQLEAEGERLRAEVTAMRQESARLDERWRREQAETSYGEARITEVQDALERQSKYARELEGVVARLEQQQGSPESAWARSARRGFSPPPAGGDSGLPGAVSVPPSVRPRALPSPPPNDSSASDSPLPPPPSRVVHAQTTSAASPQRSPGAIPAVRHVAYSVTADPRNSAPPAFLLRTTPPPPPDDSLSTSNSPPPHPQRRTSASPPPYITLPPHARGSAPPGLPRSPVPSVSGSSASGSVRSLASRPGGDGLVGVGLLLRKAANSRTVTVKEVVEDGAAARQRADVRVGDRLLFVGGKPVEGRSLTEVLEMVKGPKGSRCSLTLSRERPGGAPAVLGVELTRQWDALAQGALSRTHSWASTARSGWAVSR